MRRAAREAVGGGFANDRLSRVQVPASGATWLAGRDMVWLVAFIVRASRHRFHAGLGGCDIG